MKTNLTESSKMFHKKAATFLIAVMLTLSGIGQLFAQLAPGLLDPTTQVKFVNPLPVIKDLGLRIDATQKKGSSKMMKVSMEEFSQDLGLQIPGYTGTKVWGYKFPGLPATYPGATIVAMKDVKLRFKWENNLPITGQFLPVDASLHMAHPMTNPPMDPAAVAAWYAAGNVPTVTHLHGGHTESASDGLPEAWFTQGFLEMGNYFVKPVYKYDNDQEAATLWYHDHALGITRLNVYAGLAGFYLLRDANEMNLINTGVLPSGDYEIEMVIQDRIFDATGQLFWPAYPGDPYYDDFITGEGAILPPAVFPGGGPTALAEFFGDFILVNGKAWPKLEVEPRKYRFRLLNGSDSRFYILKLDDGTPNDGIMMVIGTDDGLLQQPVPLTQLAIAPGERYDVVIDFSGYTPNTDPNALPQDIPSITMTNWGPDAPAGGADIDPGDIANPATTGKIMQFQVTKSLSAIPDASVGLPGTPPLNTITWFDPLMAANAGNPRQLVLFEGSDEFGRLQPMLGTIANGSQTWSEPITENPALGATEIWEVYNATMDAHPIHLHLVTFQILNRQEFTPYTVDANGNGVEDPGEIWFNVMKRPQPQHNGSTGIGGDFFLDPANPLGPISPPDPHEVGWKDTFIVPPGQVGRVIANFDRLGRYVWHCHILSHEDHEMMRPFHVGPIPAPAARIASNESTVDNYPNPFQTSTQIKFELKQAQNIDFTVFDMQGKLVYQNLDYYSKGKHAIFWDGFDRNGKILQTGVYLYQLKGEYFNDSKRLVIER